MTTFVKISVTNISVYREISFKSENDRRLRASAIADYTTTTPTSKNIKFFLNFSFTCIREVSQIASLHQYV